MFCSHNEVDLVPDIAYSDGTDWVVVLCNACKQHVGGKERLIDLVERGIRRLRSERQMHDDLLDPDFDI